MSIRPPSTIRKKPWSPALASSSLTAASVISWRLWREVQQCSDSVPTSEC